MLKPHHIAGALVACMLALAACDDRPAAPVGTMAVPFTRFHQAGLATLAGTVRAPGGYAPRAVLGLNELPLAGLEVRLSALAGDEPPRKARAGEQGAFSFQEVPVGRIWLLSADVADPEGRPVTLKSLARSTEAAPPAVLSLASTLLTEALLERGAPETLDFEGFAAAVAQVAESLEASALPDLASAEAVASSVAVLEADCALADTLAALLGVPAPVCTPTPRPRSRSGGSGGGSSGGGAPAPAPAPAVGGVEATVTISDGPRLIGPTPTP